MTAEQLKAKGITDFQLDYALKSIARLASLPTTTDKGPKVAARR
jgi:carboxyl-terminal processing protease